MTNALSRVADADVCVPPYIVIHRDPAAKAAADLKYERNRAEREGDQLRRLPTELRLVVFENLLSVWPHKVYHGAFDFGPLERKEFDGEIQISWQILATCRLYHEQAYPVLYGKNRLVFCTGARGTPGMFWRFPIKPRYMQCVTDLSIFYRANEGSTQSSKRVGHFIMALGRHAVNLKHLTILFSSDMRYEKLCLWDIIFCDHPIAKAILYLIEMKTVQHLKLRFHDGARIYPNYARFLEQVFNEDGAPADRTLSFTLSCSCAPYMDVPFTWCRFCQWSRQELDFKPVEEQVLAHHVEATQRHMMEMQHDLFEKGILPPKEDTEDDDEDAAVGPYRGGGPVEDTYDEDRPAFTLGVRLPPRGLWPFRSVIQTPAVWYYTQTKITDYFGVA
ncbi:hypothetical protein NX059_007626 [Plenodomus lindquistii]|nr:hypothetical protein NX059_007626 [Plenodomus lindquistii]